MHACMPSNRRSAHIRHSHHARDRQAWRRLNRCTHACMVMVMHGMVMRGSGPHLTGHTQSV